MLILASRLLLNIAIQHPASRGSKASSAQTVFPIMAVCPHWETFTLSMSWLWNCGRHLPTLQLSKIGHWNPQKLMLQKLIIFAAKTTILWLSPVSPCSDPFADGTSTLHSTFFTTPPAVSFTCGIKRGWKKIWTKLKSVEKSINLPGGVPVDYR